MPPEDFFSRNRNIHIGPRSHGLFHVFDAVYDGPSPIAYCSCHQFTHQPLLSPCPDVKKQNQASLELINYSHNKPHYMQQTILDSVTKTKSLERHLVSMLTHTPHEINAENIHITCRKTNRTATHGHMGSSTHLSTRRARQPFSDNLLHLSPIHTTIPFPGSISDQENLQRRPHASDEINE